jgi:hypothetical protein
MMGNNKFKREAARKHNMLRIEVLAYKEHVERFPPPKTNRGLRQSKSSRISTVALLGLLGGIGQYNG